MLCQCGCGKEAGLNKETKADNKYVRGHILYVLNRIGRKGVENPAWKGGRFVSNRNYVYCYSPNNPRAIFGCYVAEHLLIAERVLGKPLSSSNVMHHINGNKEDNRNSNLVICEDRGYHNTLHRRTLAHKAGFPCHWRKCYLCGEYDSPENLFIYCWSGGSYAYHRKCKNLDQNKRKNKRREVKNAHTE